MKKWILRIGIVVVVLLVVGLFTVAMFMGTIIKKGVETVGPGITKTEMKLDGASVSILSGSGSIKGFLMGNPEGFTTPQAVKVGTVELGLKPMSVFSDKVHVTHVRMDGADITFETQGMNVMANNMNKILENVEAAAGSSQPKTTEPAKKGEGPSRKIQVDEFVIRGAKVGINSSILGGKTVTVPLPDIRLENIGSGPEGVNAAELTKVVMEQVVPAVVKAAQDAIANVSKLVPGVIRDAGGSATNLLNKTGGIGDLFKKKQ